MKLQLAVGMCIVLAGCSSPVISEPSEPDVVFDQQDILLQVPGTPAGTVRAYLFDAEPTQPALAWQIGTMENGTLNSTGQVAESWFIAWFTIADNATLLWYEIHQPMEVWKGPSANQRTVNWKDGALLLGGLDGDTLGLLIGNKGEVDLAIRISLDGLAIKSLEPSGEATGFNTEFYVDLTGGPIVHTGGGAGLTTSGITVTSDTDGLPIDRGDVRHETLEHKSDLSGWATAFYSITHRPQAGTLELEGNFQSLALDHELILGPYSGSPYGAQTDPLQGETGFTIAAEGGGLDMRVTRTLVGANFTGNIMSYRALSIGATLDELFGVAAHVGLEIQNPYG